jgi:hypothetical protein
VPKKIDLIGQRFGRLQVTAYVGNSKWSCVCDCGACVAIDGRDLRTGHTKSCGCLRREFRRIDLIGKRFDRWTALAFVGGKDRAWFCMCDCGALVVVNGSHLRGGRTKSCGCLQREVASAKFKIHGMSGTPEYNSWSSMMKRCLDPRTPNFDWYGGRGISVCEDWRSILAFFADMGPRPPGCTLDRIDVNGNYERGNVRWVDAKTQSQNRRPRQQRANGKRRRSALAALHAYAGSLAAAGSSRSRT